MSGQSWSSIAITMYLLCVASRIACAEDSLAKLRSLLAEIACNAPSNSASGNIANEGNFTRAECSVPTHPVGPVLRLANLSLVRLRNDIRDYTCTVERRERVNGHLNAPETFFVKLRHEEFHPEVESTPFSVYMRFDAPARLAGREILFSTKADDQRLLVRNGGLRLSFLTLHLEPDCPLAMNGNLYPITEFGIARLIERMLELGKQELAFAECEVKAKLDCEVDQRPCTQIEVFHPVYRAQFRYHLVRIYIDNESLLPIRFESFDWPKAPGEEPILNEQYTYREVQLNVGLTDDDFDRSNPAYRFSKK